jgi:hypothetical protein
MNNENDESLRVKLFNEMMKLSEKEQLEFIADMLEVLHRVTCVKRDACPDCDEQGGQSPSTATKTVNKRTVRMAAKNQLAVDIRYCQSEGVDLGAYIKAKYSL